MHVVWGAYEHLVVGGYLTGDMLLMLNAGLWRRAILRCCCSPFRARWGQTIRSHILHVKAKCSPTSTGRGKNWRGLSTSVNLHCGMSLSGLPASSTVMCNHPASLSHTTHSQPFWRPVSWISCQSQYDQRNTLEIIWVVSYRPGHITIVLHILQSEYCTPCPV